MTQSEETPLSPDFNRDGKISTNEMIITVAAMITALLVMGGVGYLMVTGILDAQQILTLLATAWGTNKAARGTAQAFGFLSR